MQVQFGSVLGLRCDRIEQALRQWHLVGPSSADHLALPSGIPLGFDHPLYAGGDPRAKAILDLVSSLDQHVAETQAALEVLRQIELQHGAINLDAALVVLCRALGITGPTAGGLLAVARSVGWIAHVIEQCQQEFMIRPRGKFAFEPTPDQSAV